MIKTIKIFLLAILFISQPLLCLANGKTLSSALLDFAPLPDTVTVTASHASGDQFDEVLVAVTATNFVNMTAIKLQAHWDPTAVTYLGVENPIDSALSWATEGSNLFISFSYVPVPISADDGDTLFVIRFDLTGAPGTSTSFEFTSGSAYSNNVEHFVHLESSVISINDLIPPDTVSVTIAEISGPRFSEIVVPVTVTNFTDISYFFIQTSWDPNVVTFLGVEDLANPSLQVQVFGPSIEVNSFFDGSLPLTLQENDTLFSLRFSLNGPVGSSSQLPVEGLTLYNSDGLIEAFSGNDGGITIEEIIQDDPLNFIVENVSGDELSTVFVPVRVTNFTNVDSFGFRISWDSTQLLYLGIDTIFSPSLNIADFSALQDGLGQLQAFFQDNLVTLPDSSIIFYLRFRLIGAPGTTVPLTITETFLQINDYQDTGNFLTIDGSVSINAHDPDETIIFDIGNATGPRFSEVLIPVVVRNFEDITTLHFNIAWDTTVATFLNVEDIALPYDLYIGQNGSHEIEVWGQMNPTDLPDYDTLFNLRFRLDGPYGASTPLFVTTAYIDIINYQYTSNFVFNPGSIAIDSIFSIHGSILYFNQGPVINSLVSAENAEMYADNNTNLNGEYSIDITSTNNFVISPSKLNDPDTLNGITTVDALLIRRYIRDSETFKDAVHVIAANVDQDEKITENDAQLVEDLVLGNITNFPGDIQWTFVDANHTFADIHSPFPYPQNIEVSDLDQNFSQVDFNFTGIKLGDVNIDRDNSQQSKMKSSQVITLETLNPRFVDGDFVEVSVRAYDFYELSGYQFTIDWNPAQLEFTDVAQGSLNAKFGFQNVLGGHLTTLWNTTDDAGETLEDNAELLKLRFKKLTNQPIDEVKINSSITSLQAFNAALKPVEIKLKRHDAFDDSNAVNLFPNPFNHSFTTRIFVADEQDASIQIFKADGTEVDHSIVHLRQGYNDAVSSTQSFSPGVYIVKLKLNERLVIKKVVKD
jgi:hypothetical protein